jgi:hypothetical protein
LVTFFGDETHNASFSSLGLRKIGDKIISEPSPIEKIAAGD